MKLYHTDDDVWHGTQVDAKRHAKEHDVSWELREVPTDKPGLIEYLNRIKEPSPVTAIELVPMPGQAPPDDLEAAELRAVAAASATTMSRERQLTSDTIVAFILDDATVAQAEAVFAALGTRFKELAHGPR